MCGIVGYIGPKLSQKIVLEGLARLEYRGYDSAGFACLDRRGRLAYAKAEGKLEQLVHKLADQEVDGSLGIGHTRWSTHGDATLENAHPQFDCDKTLSVVHNGIIENHHLLRQELTALGHTFASHTDTEVIAHLLEELLKSNDFESAVRLAVNRLEGAFAFVVLSQQQPDVMVVVRKRSPLCLGFGDGEMFVASDFLAFADKTKRVLFLPDGSYAFVRQDTVELFDFNGALRPYAVQEVASEWIAYEKEGHEHFMLKEIYEQKKTIQATANFLRSNHDAIWGHMGLTPEQVTAITSINLIGCGTSWHAARIAQFFFEEVTKVPARVHLASEFRYSRFFPDSTGVYICVSQSGETADTLEVLRMLNEHGLATVALTNVPSSTMVREARGALLTQAGQEVAVASTKAFSAQLAALFWLAHRIALERGDIDATTFSHAIEELRIAAEVLEECIERYKFDIVTDYAARYAGFAQSIFLGRHISYPFAMEAALKLKEVSYIFAQCYPAGELKHGPLALVDPKTPVFIFSHTNPLLYQKILSNVQEVKARRGHVVAFVFEGQHELIALADVAFVIPRVHDLLGPLAMTGVMQFLVYHIARVLGRPIDKPRNLAKSVTVE